MKNQDARQYEQKQKERARYKHFRRVHMPAGVPEQIIGNTFERSFLHFIKPRYLDRHENELYYTVNPLLILWDCGIGSFFRLLPAIILNGGLIAISHATHTGGITSSSDAVKIVGLVWLICGFIAYRRASDHMAYFNLMMLVSKYNINRKLANIIRSMSDVNKFDRYRKMDRCRMRFNKINLFPSLKETALEHQMFEKTRITSNDDARDFAHTRHDRLSLEEKREEHYAAKAIADWKENQFGVPNEYDAMVKRYARRTTPAIRDIIKQIQHNDF